MVPSGILKTSRLDYSFFCSVHKIRTLLSSDYADIALGMIFSSFLIGKETVSGSTKASF